VPELGWRFHKAFRLWDGMRFHVLDLILTGCRSHHIIRWLWHTILPFLRSRVLCFFLLHCQKLDLLFWRLVDMIHVGELPEKSIISLKGSGSVVDRPLWFLE
jgi:hypothetical protein